MPTKTRDQGKTSFVKELLIDHPRANTRAVNEAWAKAGMDGTISETLVNKTRSYMGLAGNLRGKKRGRKPKQEIIVIAEVKPAKTGARAGKDNDRLFELEAELDRLLFRAMNLGELGEVEDALRDARRRLYDAFVTKG